jgi:peptidoglycan/xylan/chitin deacetylase (PgdA/CDA1 family)
MSHCSERTERERDVVPANKMLIRTGLEALYFTGSHLALRPFFRGIGAILTLHHVRPAQPGAFQPNRLLEVTPTFLEEVILSLRRSQVDLVSLDEMRRRLSEGIFWRKFVCFTFDDGYRDNLTYAYPVLQRHAVPFAIYVPTSFPDRLGELWWLALQAVIAQNDRVGLVIGNEDRHFTCRTTREKYEVFNDVYWWLRGLPTEKALRDTVHELCRRYRIDMAAFCAELCMTWDDLAELARDPLVTIGAHTVNHVMLKKVPDGEARAEMKMSAAVIEAALGIRPRHLAYPIGDASSAGPREFALAREVGFDTAVTTRPGVLFPEHRRHLTALPRITLNGEFQRLRYLRVLLSGAATALHNGFRRVNAA